MKSLKEIQAAIEQSKEEFNKIKAEMMQPSAPDKEDRDEEDDTEEEDDMKEKMMGMMDNIAARLDYVWSAVYSVNDQLYSHGNVGHLPKLTAGQMQKMMDKCGLSEDYNVVKPNVYAKVSKGGTKFIVDFPIKNK